MPIKLVAGLRFISPTISPVVAVSPVSLLVVGVESNDQAGLPELIHNLSTSCG